MRPTIIFIVSGIATDEVLVSYNVFGQSCFPVSCNGPRSLSKSKLDQFFFLFLKWQVEPITVKAGHAYPSRSYYWIDYLKNESVSRSRNWCQIQSDISACVMSSEYLRKLCIWSDWKSLNGLSFLEDIFIKFRKTELVEIS